MNNHRHHENNFSIKLFTKSSKREKNVRHVLHCVQDKTRAVVDQPSNIWIFVQVFEYQVELIEVPGQTEDDGIKPTLVRNVRPQPIVDSEKLEVVAPDQMVTEEEHRSSDPGERHQEPDNRVRVADGTEGGIQSVDTSTKTEELSRGADVGQNTGELLSLAARGENEPAGILESSEDFVMPGTAGVQFYQSLQHSVKKCFRPDNSIIILSAINKHRDINREKYPGGGRWFC